MRHQIPVGEWLDHWILAPCTARARWSGDLLLTAVILAYTWPRLAVCGGQPHTSSRHGYLALLVLIASVSAVRIRHRRPAGAFLLTLPATCSGQALAASWIALCALARQGPHRQAWAAAAVLTLASLTRWHSTWDSLLTAEEPLRHVLDALLIGGAPTAIGLLHRTRRNLIDQVTELDTLHRQERRSLQADAVHRERTRISREMHDIVSHKAGLIAVQAGALEVTTSDPDVRTAARTLRTLAVSCLEELRSIVLVLRAGDPHAQAPLAPQPGLADVPRLVADSGVVATLHIGRNVAAMPDAVQCALYRSVQEALTNARKHAPGAAAAVRIDVAASGLILTVKNHRPPDSRDVPLPGAGYGLIGLRERADLLGGHLTAEPTPDGGFHVTLTLPRHLLPPEAPGGRD
ncbi:sensor histidine kinase [Streptomyces sp. NBC_01244]|uniref:sensor histidine kinase n=1 Tax=Streptomyces sp. NBC_01244 TaxID=2903797 RepID=UPI002E14CDF4|nr:histidine kinase [Streptomyces sp. NBC_01244]